MSVPTHVAIIISVSPLGIHEAARLGRASLFRS
jgi:hypothetical protein